jgi:hypothetical protein
MTTNVYDITAGLLTSDSRWSCELENDWIAYVDNTWCNKIIFDDEVAMLFAGDIDIIELWKCWFANGRKGEHPQEIDSFSGDSISAIGIDIKDGSIAFESDYVLKSFASDSSVVAIYSGTGGSYAKDCWQENKCARTAVRTATYADIFSGGDVLHFCRNTKDTNIIKSIPSEDVHVLMKERGYMQKNIGSQAVLIKDAANDFSNPERQTLANKVLSGKVKLSAPFPGMGQPWTNEKKSELNAFIKKYAPKK